MTISITTLRLLAGAIALGTLSACAEDPGATMSAATPGLAEQACLRDVSATTNNGDVTVIEALESEAGTQFTIGVGPDRAPWRCIGYSDGTTADIMSLTDEGAL